MIHKCYQPIYDQAKVVGRVCSVRFFQVPLGSTINSGVILCSEDGNIKNSPDSSVPATQIVTNIDQGNSLPYPKKFVIEGLSIAGEIDKHHPYVKKSWMRLFIHPYDYLVVPLRYIYQNIEEFDINLPGFKFLETVSLDPQISYRVEVNTPIPTVINKPFTLDCILHGFYAQLTAEEKQKYSKEKN